MKDDRVTLIDRAEPEESPALAAALDALGASAEHWTIDAHASSFELRGRYVFGLAVTARFAIDAGHVDIASHGSGITGVLLLDAASLDSGIGLRDQHLRERRNALDVTRFPNIRFDLDRAAPGPRSTFDIWGRVTLRDVTRPVQLHVDARVEGDQADLIITGDVEHQPFKIDLPGLNRKMTVHARLRLIANRPAARRRPKATS